MIPLRSLFHDREGGGLPMTMQVKSTSSPASPGICVVVGVEVTIVGRAETKYKRVQFISNELLKT